MYYDKSTSFVPETKNSQNYVICWYWYLNDQSKFYSVVFYSCHNLFMMTLGINNTAIVSIKGTD